MSPSTRPRRRRRLVAVAVSAALLAAAPLTSASAAGSGSGGAGSAQAQADAKARQLDAARAVAKTQADKLAAAKSAVVAAQQQLTSLAVTARAAIDRFNAAMAKLDRARAVADAAKASLAAAVQHVADAQRAVDDFVRAAYMSGGPLTGVATVLNAGGPAEVMDQASILQEVAKTQARLLQELSLAKQQQAMLAAAATSAMQAVAAETAKADAARRAAVEAMTGQQALLRRLTTEQAVVAAALAKQDAHVAALARQRAAAQRKALLEQQQAEFALAWASMEKIGESMPWASAKQGRTALAWAKKQLGVPYSWGGGDASGPTLGFAEDNGNTAGEHTVGFDCSGLTLYAWAHAGFTLDHYTGYQWVEGHHIPLDKLRLGDLVFFATDVSDPTTIHHVGIYAGGNWMIDAPHTGAAVRYDHVFVSGLIGAVRP